MSEESNMSAIKHEINHNLGLILEANRLLFQDSSNSENSREFHQAIVRGSQGLMNSINNLLDLCGGEARINIDFSEYTLRRDN